MKAKDSTAPQPLEQLRLFVNTADLEHPENEALATASAATSWLHAHSLLPADQSLSEEERQSLTGLREAFRIELLAHTGDAGTAEPDVLSVYTEQAKLGVRLSTSGEMELVAEGNGAQLVAGRLFAIMYDAVAQGQWQRLKACRKHSCLLAFFDHSKNGSGAWCDMAVCGNRVKAQRRRIRLNA